MLEKDSLDFSFSGLKSAVKREVDRRRMKNEELQMTNNCHPELVSGSHEIRGDAEINLPAGRQGSA